MGDRVTLTWSLKFRVMTQDFFWVMTLTRSRSTTLNETRFIRCLFAFFTRKLIKAFNTMYFETRVGFWNGT